MVRDLVPITLVAGAAAVAVTFVVGGTTAQLSAPTAVTSPPWPMATAPSPVGPAGSVSTRTAAPSRAKASTSATALELAGSLLTVGRPAVVVRDVDLRPDGAVVRVIGAPPRGAARVPVPAAVDTAVLSSPAIVASEPGVTVTAVAASPPGHGAKANPKLKPNAKVTSPSPSVVASRSAAADAPDAADAKEHGNGTSNGKAKGHDEDKVARKERRLET